MSTQHYSTYTTSIVCVCSPPWDSLAGLEEGLQRKVPFCVSFNISVARFLYNNTHHEQVTHTHTHSMVYVFYKINVHNYGSEYVCPYGTAYGIEY